MRRIGGCLVLATTAALAPRAAASAFVGRPALESLRNVDPPQFVEVLDSDWEQVIEPTLAADELARILREDG